jgi:hypothetical protein
MKAAPGYVPAIDLDESSSYAVVGCYVVKRNSLAHVAILRGDANEMAGASGFVTSLLHSDGEAERMLVAAFPGLEWERDGALLRGLRNDPEHGMRWVSVSRREDDSDWDAEATNDGDGADGWDPHNPVRACRAALRRAGWLDAALTRHAPLAAGRSLES